MTKFPFALSTAELWPVLRALQLATHVDRNGDGWKARAVAARITRAIQRVSPDEARAIAEWFPCQLEEPAPEASTPIAEAKVAGVKMPESGV